MVDHCSCLPFVTVHNKPPYLYLYVRGEEAMLLVQVCGLLPVHTFSATSCLALLAWFDWNILRTCLHVHKWIRGSSGHNKLSIWAEE